VRRLFRIATLALACAGLGSAQAQLAPRQVEAPHYGDTLFEFFQDKHFEALTGLMVSQHFDRVKPHDPQAEVLRGGLLLSYGLHQEAGQVFARLIESSAPPPVRDRAWYHLAKIRYQRGLTDQAGEALARVEQTLPAPLEEDRQLLAAQLLMARADYAGAAAVLAALPPKASLVARYNLGVALVKAGDAAQGSALLDQIGQLPAFDEEQRALRDRANVALGFAALQNRKPADSRRYLQRVRLDGLSSSKALLGFGWAAAELGEPKSALAPWQELVRRPVSDPAVLEARIAMPYALAEIGAAGQALEGYEQAVGQFDGERKSLDQSIAAIRQGVLIDGLIANNPRGGLGWYGSLDKIPDARQMPHGGHLTALLAGHEFQEAFKNLRDLIFLGGNLEGWKDKLVVYKDMLANRRQAFAERLPKVRDKAGALELPKVQQRRDALAEELNKAEADTDVLVFADARQRDALARVEAGHATLKQADPDAKDAELAVARERLRRVQGALTWQLTQTYPDRLWTAHKALKVADAELAQAMARDANLVRAAQEEPQRFEKFAERIAALEQRIAGLVPRVAALHREQQGQLQDIAVAELEAQKERLEVYAQQARLAIAQLHDRAQLAQSRNTTPGAGDAPR
jgi:hypothetical protein